MSTQVKLKTVSRSVSLRRNLYSVHGMQNNIAITKGNNHLPNHVMSIAKLARRVIYRHAYIVNPPTDRLSGIQWWDCVCVVLISNTCWWWQVRIERSGANEVGEYMTSDDERAVWMVCGVCNQRVRSPRAAAAAVRGRDIIAAVRHHHRRLSSVPSLCPLYVGRPWERRCFDWQASARDDIFLGTRRDLGWLTGPHATRADYLLGAQCRGHDPRQTRDSWRYVGGLLLIPAFR